MNHQRSSIAFAVVAALALSGVGCSNHSGTPNESAPLPTTATTAPVPPTASTARAVPIPAPISTSAEPAMGSTSGQATDFAVLAGSKGYVTQDDAQRDPWMRTHFAECDSNHDGHVTREEFAQCHAQPGQDMGMPGSAASTH